MRPIDAEKVVSIVEKWSSDHPRKTRQDVFFGTVAKCTNGIWRIADLPQSCYGAERMAERWVWRSAVCNLSP